MATIPQEMSIKPYRAIGIVIGWNNIEAVFCAAWTVDLRAASLFLGGFEPRRNTIETKPVPAERCLHRLNYCQVTDVAEEELVHCVLVNKLWTHLSHFSIRWNAVVAVLNLIQTLIEILYL